MVHFQGCCQRVQLNDSIVLTSYSLNEFTKNQSKPEVAKIKIKPLLTCGFPLLPFPRIPPSLCEKFSDIKL